MKSASRRMRAADRMSRWIDKLIEEDCTDGIRWQTLMRAEDARIAYEKAKRG